MGVLYTRERYIFITNISDRTMGDLSRVSTVSQVEVERRARTEIRRILLR